MQRNAKLLLGLINDVLDISKIEAGKVEIHEQLIALASLSRQIEADYGEPARTRGLAFRAEVAPGLDSVRSDPGRVLQIVANLVGNALKFTERGSISVRFEPREKSQWAIVVADTGIGIPEEEQTAIFDEFRQGEAVEHRGRGGTGLGLAIVRKLADVLGGTISVESEAGKGSRFTVVLPRELPERPVAPTPTGVEAWPAPPAQSDRSVLVVDDDEGVRRLLAYELAPSGIQVLEASDGRSALEIAVAERPGAILLDVLMPGPDGWETLHNLKQRPETRNIPVIMLSVVENRAFGLSLGAFDYLEKPLDVSKITDSLSRAGVLASRGHLLVVDDDADVRQLLSQELATAGYRVLEAEGGRSPRGDAAGEAERGRARPHDETSGWVRGSLPDAGRSRVEGDPGRRRYGERAYGSGLQDPPGAARRVVRKGTDPSRLVAEVVRAVNEDKTA